MKAKTRVLLTSAVSVAMCASLIAGSTYALFTDESKVNVAVTSGRVDVEAVVGELTLTSKGVAMQDNWENGGTASIKDGVVTLDRITPGDKVTFPISITNNSNVTIKYRTSVVYTTGDELLLEGLNVTFSESAADLSTFDGTAYYTAWETAEATQTDLGTVDVAIELPYLEENQNMYQDLSVNFGFKVEAVQGNADIPEGWNEATDTTWYNDTDKTFELSTPDQLAGLAELVNAGNTFAGKTITLTEDMNLENTEWTPIGKSDATFQGTFDGAGYTVSNLSISGNASNVGLFGFTQNGEIKNLTVKNAKVSGRLNVGAVSGTPYTSKYNNIKVTGDVKIEGMSYVGAMGGKNLYANTNNVIIDVNEGSYVKATSTENGMQYRTYVGGLVGFMGEGGHTVSNVKSNIDVIGDVCDVGGLVGIAHYGNNFVNCSSSGDVTLTGDDTEVGGIAGVWHNGGSNVTFTDCSYTGTITVNGQVFDCANDGIVNTAYDATGSGQLIINNADLVIKTVAQFQAFAADVNAGNNYAGKTVKLMADLDLAGIAWTPIGKEGAPFQGTFDGTTATISNLTVTGEDCVGLFGRTENSSVIKNVRIHNASVKGVKCVGVVAGSAYTGRIESSSITGKVQVEGSYKVGGFTGETYHWVKNSSIEADAESYVKGVYLEADLEGDNVGGIVGFFGEGSGIRAENCYAAINVEGTRKVGGIAGYLHENNKVSGCTYSGTVSCNADAAYIADNAAKLFVGGIIGEVDSVGAIENCTVVAGSVVDGYSETTMGALFGGSRKAGTPTQKGNTVDGVILK